MAREPKPRISVEVEPGVSSASTPSAQFADVVFRCWPWISTFSGLAIMMAALALQPDGRRAPPAGGVGEVSLARFPARRGLPQGQTPADQHRDRRKRAQG